MEKNDLKVLKNEMVVLNSRANKNMLANTYQSSIYDVAEVAVKEEDPTSLPLNIQTKKTSNGQNSIFVDAYSVLRTFPARPSLKCYDPVQKQFVRQSVMLNAHLTCSRQIDNLPRQIDRKDKTVKFDKKYSGLFKKNQNYKNVFDYDLHIEENRSKTSSKTKIKQGESFLFKKYGEKSKNYLRENLFENPYIIKSEECKYSDMEGFVTIYYDQFKDIFAIVDQKKNCLVDLGIATEVDYAEIFVYHSSQRVKSDDICERPEDMSPKPSPTEESQPDLYVMSKDDAQAILDAKYDSGFVTVANGELIIGDYQAAKKLEHSQIFNVYAKDFGFSDAQAIEINRGEYGIRGYVQRGNELPSMDYVRAYQKAVKSFCEDPNQSIRNDESTFGGEPSITFYNKETRQVAIFERETKKFKSAYRLSLTQLDNYLITGNIGVIRKDKD